MQLSFNPTDHQAMMALSLLWAARESTTRKLIEWLDENPTARREVYDLVKTPTGGWIEEAALRAAVLSQISPLHPESGPILGLKCILVEGSLGLIDWSAVLVSLRPA